MKKPATSDSSFDPFFKFQYTEPVVKEKTAKESKRKKSKDKGVKIAK